MAEFTDEEENDPVMKENVSKWMELNMNIKRVKKQVSDLLAAQKLLENEIIREYVDTAKNTPSEVWVAYPLTIPPY